MAAIDPATMQLPRSADVNPSDLKIINTVIPVTLNPNTSTGTDILITEGQDFPRGDGNL